MIQGIIINRKDKKKCEQIYPHARFIAMPFDQIKVEFPKKLTQEESDSIHQYLKKASLKNRL